MLRTRIATLVVMSALAAACADTPSPLLSARSGSAFGAESSGEAEARQHQVARGIALAMARPEIRAQVRNAMRRSLVTEHKLVLQEYVHTPGGVHLVRAAAAAAGMRSDEFSGLVASLPPMDFYVPFREHRTGWRAGGDVLVGATMDVDRPELAAYTTSGAGVTLDARNGVPAQALLIIHPAEPKSLRENPQHDVPGEVIQDFTDGETSEGGGDYHVAGCSIYARECFPDFESGGGGVAAPDTTYIDYIKVSNWGEFWGGLELEFRATYRRAGTGEVLASGSYRKNSIAKDTPYYVHNPLIARTIPAGSADYINVRVIEKDNIWDDDKGNRDYTYGERAQIIGIIHDTWWEGNVLKHAQTFLELDWEI